MISSLCILAGGIFDELVRVLTTGPIATSRRLITLVCAPDIPDFTNLPEEASRRKEVGELRYALLEALKDVSKEGRLTLLCHDIHMLYRLALLDT